MAGIKNTFVYRPFIAGLRAIPRDLRPPVLDALKQSAVNMLAGQKRSLLENTPPSNSVARGRKAQAQGEQAIKTDLLGGRRTGFGNKTGKRAGIFTVLDDSLLANAKHLQDGNVRLFVKKDGTIWGADQQMFRPNASIAEMRDHHRRYFRNGVMTAAGSNDRTIGRWKFISKMIVSKASMDAYLRWIYGHVGMFAASQMGAAPDLGIGSRLPAWVKRHPLMGHARWIVNEDQMIVQMTFEPIFAQGEVRARLASVRRYAQDAFNRRLPHILASVARKRGFRSGVGILT